MSIRIAKQLLANGATVEEAARRSGLKVSEVLSVQYVEKQAKEPKRYAILL